MANEIFKKRMKELRQRAGISMDQLAAILNVSKSRISMWENNGSIPRNETLLSIAKYYNVSTDYLLGNDSEKARSPISDKLNYLQRNLGKLNQSELDKAEGMLKAVFSDVFNDDEEEDDGI